MDNIICINGEQKTPSGESGIYFICNYGEHKGSHCRYVKWCSQLNRYESSTDDKGNMCPDFAVKKNITNNQPKINKIEPVG
jgi:hypothetical protein